MNRTCIDWPVRRINDVWERPFKLISIVEFYITPENGVVERLLFPLLDPPLFVLEYVANNDGGG
jgi:hypothetical protein